MMLFSGIDNYLFDNKKDCSACLNEINSGKRIKPGESFDCKGRYGDKPQNKFFIMRYFNKADRTENEQQMSTTSGEIKLLFKHDFLMKEQNGLNESAIKQLCPLIYKTQSK